MKGVLLDQNLPVHLLFSPSWPVIHATALGSNPTDSELWIHAREHDLVIVTKDADFSGRVILADATLCAECYAGRGSCCSAEFSGRLPKEGESAAPSGTDIPVCARPRAFQIEP